MGRNMVVIAVLLVTSVMEAVIRDKHIIIAHIGQPPKKFKPLPMVSDNPDT